MTEKKVKTTKEKKPASKSAGKEQKKTSSKYWYAVGRRKASVAQVRIYKSAKAEAVIVLIVLILISL